MPEQARDADGHEMPHYMSTIAGLTEHANALRGATIEEFDWAAVANQLRTIEKDLGEKRREIEGLATDVMQASRKANPEGSKMVYESDRGDLREQVTRKRSFNSSGILVALMEHVPTIGEALEVLQSANALALNWKVSFLENVADRYGFDLPTTHHEIEDGDPDYLVGVVSVSEMKRG